ncbi:MAG: LuxR C-terminal-related transcriptional regulator [Verrucomicrobiota bacterium]
MNNSVLRTAVGEPGKAIASRLKISPRTVEGFLTAIRRKTGTETTAQAGCKLARILARVKTRA